MHWWPGLGAQIATAALTARIANDIAGIVVLLGQDLIRVPGPDERQRERQNSDPNQLFP
jgi:hypothetical protein